MNKSNVNNFEFIVKPFLLKYDLITLLLNLKPYNKELVSTKYKDIPLSSIFITNAVEIINTISDLIIKNKTNSFGIIYLNISKLYYKFILNILLYITSSDIDLDNILLDYKYDFSLKENISNITNNEKFLKYLSSILESLKNNDIRLLLALITSNDKFNNRNISVRFRLLYNLYFDLIYSNIKADINNTSYTDTDIQMLIYAELNTICNDIITFENKHLLTGKITIDYSKIDLNHNINMYNKDKLTAGQLLIFNNTDIMGIISDKVIKQLTDKKES